MTLMAIAWWLAVFAGLWALLGPRRSRDLVAALIVAVAAVVGVLGLIQVAF